MAEDLDRRVLGAIRFLDVTTGMQVRDRLSLSAEGVVFRPVRGGSFAIFQAPGLESHVDAFPVPPAAPPLFSITLGATVRDGGRRYLQRRFTVALPRDPDSAHADQAGSLFRAQDVQLFPAPAAPVAHGWAAVRASVRDTSSERPLAATLFRVTQVADGALMASGLSDERGEALIRVPGIPVATAQDGAGPVMTTEVEVRVAAFHAPGPSGAIPDPDQLERDQAGLPTAAASVRLASGRTVALTLHIDAGG